MRRGHYHPRAVLSKKRNVKRGVEARSQILNLLEAGESAIRYLADHAQMRYSKVAYHLRLLEAENLVTRTTHRRRNIWRITGFGQQRLNR